MAGRPKKEDTEEIVEEKEMTHEELSVDELKKLLAQAQETIIALSKLQVQTSFDGNGETEPQDEYEDIKVGSDEYITVISTCSSELNLSTQGNGRGKVFRFKEFGTTKRILYSDLVDIMEAHDNFLHDGYFYIADKRVIRKHGLDDVYDSLLDKSKIESILNGKSKNTVELFKSANPKQQQFICDLLVTQITNSENEDNIDLNLIDAISRISGVKIYEKAQESKFYQKK
jgi:hypothetical protein